MSKTIAALALCTALCIIFSGCSPTASPKELITRGFRASLSFADEEGEPLCSGILDCENGEYLLRMQSPTELFGLSFRFSQGELWALSGELCVPVEKGAFPLVRSLCQALDALAETPVPSKPAEHYGGKCRLCELLGLRVKFDRTRILHAEGERGSISFITFEMLP